MKKIISGKVREVYEVDGDKLVIVTTDRISAFDVILSKPVKDKGIVLNKIALFWFDYTKDIVPNHIISSNLSDLPDFFQKDEYKDRTILVKKLDMLPFEFIVRGYIFGNMWNAYCDEGEFCGIKIKPGYRLAEKLEAPLFTPSTKETEGHDVYVSFETMANALGNEIAEQAKDICFKIYEKCRNYAYEKGIIIADTKFELGRDKDGNLVLADEVLTPDSSRFWSLDDYEIGVSPKSYDKQFVRDWLLENKENGKMRFDDIPNDIMAKTSDIYRECLERLV